MSIFYPPKLGLFDPTTNKPIYFADTESESGIYDSTERNRVLVIRASASITYEVWFESHSLYQRVFPLMRVFLIVPILQEAHTTHPILEVQDGMTKWEIGACQSFFQTWSSGRIGFHLGMIRSFGYGKAGGGEYNDIVIRAAKIFELINPEIPDCPPEPAVIDTIRINGWIGEWNNYTGSGGTTSNAISLPILDSDNYKSTIPTTSAYICTLRCKVSDGSITYLY